MDECPSLILENQILLVIHVQNQFTVDRACLKKVTIVLSAVHYVTAKHLGRKSPV